MPPRKKSTRKKTARKTGKPVARKKSTRAKPRARAAAQPAEADTAPPKWVAAPPRELTTGQSLTSIAIELHNLNRIALELTRATVAIGTQITRLNDETRRALAAGAPGIQDMMSQQSAAVDRLLELFQPLIASALGSSLSVAPVTEAQPKQPSAVERRSRNMSVVQEPA